MKTRIHKVLLYPEEYIIEEDLKEMGDSNPHTILIDYLKAILKHYYALARWLIISNMDVRHPAIHNSRNYIVPDVTLVKVVLSEEEEATLISWNAERLAPSVTFEVSSKGTWPNDVRERDSDKPAIYARIGTKEYFAYDPHQPQVWARSGGVRLRGWRSENGRAVEIIPDEQGRLWSVELDSYLVPDGRFLRLTDREGKMRLTEAQAATQAQNQAFAAQQAATQAQNQALVAQQAAELRAYSEMTERQAEATARQQAEQNAQAEATARQQAELQVAELQRQIEELRRLKQAD